MAGRTSPDGEARDRDDRRARRAAARERRGARPCPRPSPRRAWRRRSARDTSRSLPRGRASSSARRTAPPTARRTLWAGTPRARRVRRRSVATGFYPLDAGDRRYNVNRPTESQPGAPPADEVRRRPRGGVPDVPAAVTEVSQGPLASTWRCTATAAGERGPHGDRHRRRQPRRRVAARDAPRDDPRRAPAAEGEVPRLDVVDGGARYNFGTPPPRPSGRACSARTPLALHIELPRAARTKYREAYTTVLAEFLVQSAARCCCRPRADPVRPVFTAAEMRALDARAIRDLGIPGFQLMDEAGAGAAALIAPMARPDPRPAHASSCAARATTAATASWWRAGSGPAARAVTVFLPRGATRCGATPRRRSRGWRGRVEEIDAGPDPGALGAGARAAPTASWTRCSAPGSPAPPGARPPPPSRRSTAGRRAIPVVALDLPSGLSSDHGALLGPTVKATRTVTFAGLKRSLLLHPAAGQAGPRRRRRHRRAGGGSRARRHHVAARGRRRAPAFPRARGRRPQGPLRPSPDRGGLAGQDRRGGARRPRRAPERGRSLHDRDPASQQPIVAAQAPEYMTEPLAETAARSLALAARERLLELAAPHGRGRARARALAPPRDAGAGPRPGGRGGAADGGGRRRAQRARRAPRRAASRARPRALTPHPGEMARMLGVTHRGGAGRPNRDRPELRAATIAWGSRSRARAP